MKTILLTGVAAALTAMSCMAQTERFFGAGIDNACFSAATMTAQKAKVNGTPDDKVQKNYQTALAQCSGLQPDMAYFAGSVNFDYSRFARMVAYDKISPSLYLGLVRDRSKKMRAARKDPSYLVAFVHGDADGDLVPDTQDQCPGTPDLTITDLRGCPVREPLPQAPNSRDIHTSLDGLGFVTSPACDGSPVPQVSAPLKGGYDDQTRNTYRLAVTKVDGQKPGCVVLYEIQIHFSQPTLAAPSPELGLQVVFRASENLDKGSSGFIRQVFQVSGSDTGRKKQLYDYARYYNKKEIRVRAVNGDGLTSPWSGILISNDPSFHEH